MEKNKNFYVAEFDKSKETLNKISTSFCAAKWLQVSLHLTNGRTHSCYHPPTHKIDLTQLKKNPSALHNTKQKFQERKMMLLGERPEGCNYCWKIEDAGHISDRFYRSSEHWAVNDLNFISTQPFDYNVNPTYVEVNFNQTCNFKCSYCSPHLSSTWQEEIEEFGPYVIENYIHNNIQELKDIDYMPVEVSNKNNPYVQAFWEWWPNLYTSLKVFRMTGGEPLMDHNTFKVLDYVIENPNKELELSVTSNLCPPKDQFEKFLNKVKQLDEVQYDVECYVPDPKNGSEWQNWQHFIIGKENKIYHNSNLPSIERNEIPQTFPEIGQALEDGSFTYLYRYKDKACKHFTLYVSLDSVDEQAEYIRYGLNYDTLLHNVERFLNETRNTSITFINTFNILSVNNFKKFLEMILSLREKHSKNIQKEKYGKAHQRVWFDIPVLQNPSWMSVLNCDDDLLNELKKIYNWMRDHNSIESYNATLTGFKDYEIEKLKRNITLIEENRFAEKEKLDNLNKFKIFFNEHDRRRNTDFKKTFPEMIRWMNV